MTVRTGCRLMTTFSTDRVCTSVVATRELDGFFLEFDDPLDLVLLPFLNPMAAPDDDPDRTVEENRTQCPSNPP